MGTESTPTAAPETPADFLDRLRGWQIIDHPTPLNDFATRDCANDCLSEAWAMVQILETGLCEHNSEVDALVPEIKSYALRGVGRLIALAKFSLDEDDRRREQSREAGR